MITWIQRYFQKHFRLVFLLVLAAMAIPLIVIFSPSSGAGRTTNKLLERPFFGVNLGNEAQARQVFTDGSLSANLGPDFANFAGREGAQRYALERVAGLALADELHLPAPTADQVSRFVATLRAFQNEQGQFDQKRYTQFGDSLKLGSQLTPAMVNRVLRDDTRLDQLSKIVGGPGYVMPTDIKQQLIRTDSSWTVQVATLDYATFAPPLAPTDEALKKFFDENSFRYEVPVRPRFTMVEFKGAAFLPPVEPTETEVRNYYNSNPAAFPVPPDADKKDATPAATPASPTDNFPKVRAQVVAAMKQAASARLASKAANDLTVALFERKLTANSPELAAFLASTRLPVTAVPSFDPNNPPPDKPWLANHTEAIARLSKERFFSDPLPTTDSFVVLLWNETMPAYKPLFTEVREHVTADFKEQEKRRLFIERGRAVRTALQAAAKTPAGFAAAAATEKLEIKSYANFTFREPPADLPAPALQGLQRLEAGQVSEMSASAEKGYLAYVQEKKLPELSASNPRYAEMQKQLKLFTAGYNEASYLGELVDRELKKTETTKTP